MKGVDVIYAQVQEYAGPLVVQFRLFSPVRSSFLGYGEKVDPKPIQVSSRMICFLLPKFETQSFVELDCLANVLHIAGYPMSAGCHA